MTVVLQAPVQQTIQIPEPRVEMDRPRRRDTLLLATAPSALSSAYSFIVLTLERWQTPQLIDNASVLVHQLVTNALEQAPQDLLSLIRINLFGFARFVIIEVHDSSSVCPPELEDGYEGEASLLEALHGCSRRWGGMPTPTGKLIWAEPLPAPEITEAGLPKRRPAPTPYPRESPTPPARQ